MESKWRWKEWESEREGTGKKEQMWLLNNKDDITAPR